MAFIVLSSRTNAYSLMQGVRQLGWDMACWDDEAKFVPSSSHPPQKGDTLFFTDEASLGKYFPEEDLIFLPKVLTFPLDDKLLFSDLLKQIGEAPVPYARWEDRGSMNFPALLKARHSWRGGRKVPRGSFCASLEEMQEMLLCYEECGNKEEWFFIQASIPDGVSNCFSVSGFFDYTGALGHCMAVTQKISCTSGGLGVAQTIRVVTDPGDLIYRTKGIMTALKYTGPFELEFLYSRENETFYVLELNPRFWMQHGLFERFGENAVIRKYLGDASPIASEPLQLGILWLNGTELLKAFLTPLRTDSRRFLSIWFTAILKCTPRMVSPPLPVMLRYGARRISRKWGLSRR